MLDSPDSQTTADPVLRRSSAAAVLQLNDQNDHTIPAHGLYPFRWLWDSALIAIGWAEFDEKRAWTELEASMSSQWASGMVPSIDFGSVNRMASYFPGPDVWEAPHRTTGVTQPPIAATIALEMLKNAQDRDLADAALRSLYPKLLAFHRWLYDVRQAGETGQLLCLHPWETGMDNSPVWDAPLRAIDLTKLPSYARRDITHVDESNRPEGWFYDMSYALLLELKSRHYDTRQATLESPFAVADICFNALAVKASADLIELGRELGEDTGEATEWLQCGEAGIASMWNPAAEMFTSYDWRTHKPIDIATSAGFLPLLTSVPTQHQIGQLIGVLSRWSEKVNYLVPSMDPYHDLYDPRRYWRGPVWININWFIATGLARHGHTDLAETIRQDSIALIEKSGYWEYFEPTSGAGLGASDFSWTAALDLGWLQ
jgi:hypothetical protein